MEAVRIALLLIAAALACAAMRAQRPELSAGVALAAGAAALTMLLPGLRQVASALTLFAGASRLDGGAALILRATGVSLLTEFAAHICEDAGEKALASRVELAARVTLFAMAAPLLTEVVTAVTGALA